MPYINQPSGGGGGAPTGAAGGDLGSTYPNPTVVGATHITAASIALAKLADPTTGKVVGSVTNAAAAVFPPGFEIGYDQITSPVNITSTTEASGTTIITCAAHTFDGAPVMAEFFGIIAGANNAVTNLTVISLFEGATQITELATLRPEVTTGAAIETVTARFRFTPTAASHTYTITGFVSFNQNAAVSAGAGGTGANPPAFIRFTKV